MQTKFFPPRFQNVTANGDPIVGSLEFYQTGTSTKITTYSDYTRSTANTNPLNADSNGRFGPVFFAPADLTNGIKVSYFDAINGAAGTGTVVFTDDRYDYNTPTTWDDISATQTNVGSVLYPRTNAETLAGISAYFLGNPMGEIVQPWFPPGTIERYGVNTTPGTTDMAAAIQAAFDQLEQAGGADVVFQSRQVYKIGTGITWYADNSTVQGNGARIQHSADICPLTIGELGSGKSMARSRILGGLDFEYTGTAGTSTQPGVQIYQSIEGDYHFNSILNYNKGIYMTSTSSGCAYNKIHFDRIKNCFLYGIHLYGDAGYVNENKFYCGRFTMVGSGGWHVYHDKESASSYNPNHNTYYSPCFEMSAGSDMDGYIYDDGHFNTYFEPRLELGGSETINEDRIRFGTKSIWCSIYGGYNFDGHDIDDLGEHNRWFMRDQIKIDAGNASQAASILKLMRAQPNDASGQNPVALCEDLYGTDTQGETEVFKARGRRNSAAGYFYDAERAGSMVVGIDDGFTYECILAHNGAAADRPGVTVPTANWATYWRKLNTKDGGATWVNGTSYTAPATQFRIASDGKIWTNQAVADTSAPPGTCTYKLEIFDSAGASLGFIPIYASI